MAEAQKMDMGALVAFLWGCSHGFDIIWYFLEDLHIPSFGDMGV